MKANKIEKLNKIAELKVATLKKIELLDELAESIKAEECVYMIRFDTITNRYYIVEMSNGIVQFTGTKAKAKQWLERRGYENDDYIYKYDLLCK